MKKKLYLSALYSSVISVALLASTNAFAVKHYKGDYKGEASPCPACMSVLTLSDGFYVGLAGGYEAYNMRQSNSAATAGFASSTSQPVAAQGWVGGALAGYGKYLNDMYYLGGELFLNGSSASGSQNSTTSVAALGTVSSSARSSVGASYGFMVLPGIKLSPSTLAYVRLGYSRAYIKQQISVTGGQSAHNNNWSNGFAYGLGMESAVYQNWSVRGDYTYVSYSSIRSSTSAAGTSASTSVRPSDNQFLVSMIYHIA